MTTTFPNVGLLNYFLLSLLEGFFFFLFDLCINHGINDGAFSAELLFLQVIVLYNSTTPSTTRTPRTPSSTRTRGRAWRSSTKDIKETTGSKRRRQVLDRVLCGTVVNPRVVELVGLQNGTAQLGQAPSMVYCQP